MVLQLTRLGAMQGSREEQAIRKVKTAIKPMALAGKAARHEKVQIFRLWQKYERCGE